LSKGGKKTKGNPGGQGRGDQESGLITSRRGGRTSHIPWLKTDATLECSRRSRTSGLTGRGSLRGRGEVRGKKKKVPRWIPPGQTGGETVQFKGEILEIVIGEQFNF